MMLYDSARLGYSAAGGRIFVHYPNSAAYPDYGAGVAIGDIPVFYWTDPPNEATRERVAIWEKLLGSPYADGES